MQVWVFSKTSLPFHVPMWKVWGRESTKTERAPMKQLWHWFVRTKWGGGRAGEEVGCKAASWESSRSRWPANWMRRRRLSGSVMCQCSLLFWWSRLCIHFLFPVWLPVPALMCFTCVSLALPSCVPAWILTLGPNKDLENCYCLPACVCVPQSLCSWQRYGWLTRSLPITDSQLMWACPTRPAHINL